MIAVKDQSGATPNPSAEELAQLLVTLAERVTTLEAAVTLLRDQVTPPP
jgi:hypothetical protein